MKCSVLKLASLFALTISLAAMAHAQGVKPTILVYSGTDPGFATMMAEMIASDERIDANVQVVLSSDILTLATVLPQTQCIIIYASNKAEVEGLQQPLESFFDDGGGLIGMKEPCYVSSGQELAKEVFPTFANVSLLSSPRNRVRTYTVDQRNDINSGLPDTFQLPSMGIYLCGDKKKQYLANCEASLPQGATILYRDQETGAPLVVAYQNENGGRSVGFTGVSVVSSPRVDIYYGKLVADENFTKLFLNSVVWASQGSSRFSRISANLSETLQEAKERQQRLKEESQQASRRRATQRLALLVVFWILGLAACVVILKKAILLPLEE